MDKSEEEAIRKASKQTETTKHKIVTLGGTVIHKSGNMTGGLSAKGDKSGKLRASSDKTASKMVIHEREYEKLKKRQNEIVEELLKLEGETAAEYRAKDEEQKLETRVSDIHWKQQGFFISHDLLTFLVLLFCYPFRFVHLRVV